MIYTIAAVIVVGIVAYRWRKSVKRRGEPMMEDKVLSPADCETVHPQDQWHRIVSSFLDDAADRHGDGGMLFGQDDNGK